jgi:cyclopropane-fatty-acyl-phospholipid synthase
MKSSTLSQARETPAKPRLFVHPLALALRPWLGRIAHGQIELRLPSGEFLAATRGPGPAATLHLHNWRAVRRLLLRGSIGFAEGYIDGDWSTPDLVSLIAFGARNTEALGKLAGGGGAVHRLINRITHARRANSRRGSRRNIVSHYDLGNEFFALWLDSTKLYSSALWSEGAETLEQAQGDKLARIAKLMDLNGGEDILEIGCGWGALAVHLARAGAGAITGLTLSPSQLAFARARCAREAPGASIDLRLQDYRDVSGTYDRVVSIEMIEAVGEAFWPSYFAKIADSLRPGGKALIQAITIEEQRFDEYRAEPDFIQRYIFPGGFLPTKTIMREQAERAGLTLAHVECFGPSYARTLAEWRNRFEASWPEIAALGFDEKFRRLWTYYLCYCEAGFVEDATDVGFYLLQKPEAQ